MALDDFDPNERLGKLTRHVGDGYDSTYPLSGAPFLTSDEIDRDVDNILRPSLVQRYHLARHKLKEEHPRVYGFISALYRIASSFG